MTANVTSYLDLVERAYQGELKLPAFQRKWKWKRPQVALLYDSLRRGYPIGSFLFMEPSTNIKLAPRPFQCTPEKAADATEEWLVLDGQQRLTAGLELF
jgi:uncharacterized protein with ParB-like and HNH nuclease domain